MPANREDMLRCYRAALDREPFPYQKRLALEEWPDILEIPTGLGKTAAVILAWVLKRLRNDAHTPRRLIYVLPMRALVEQVFSNAAEWIQRLEDVGMLEKNRMRICKLLGGDIDQEWDSRPEAETVIIGTQDQLLSRALNRGYSMSRFRWPVHFGLLNNDCLWVMDEVQLMGAGLATTTQLDAFRTAAGAVFPCRSLWMSATLDKRRLDSVDFRSRLKDLVSLSISDEDAAFEIVARRLSASKTVAEASCADNGKAIAEFVLREHSPASRSLVLVNTVERAQDIYRHILKVTTKSKKSMPLVRLLHSRFRPPDRQRILNTLLGPIPEEGIVCIATQVLEAGVDITSKLLVTDLSPFSSLIQRFGRVNRYGEERNARIFWLKPSERKRGWAAPYDEEALRKAREFLRTLEGGDAGPASLAASTPREDIRDKDAVLRKKDLYELFDTTPDLSGFDVDVSRFIRHSDGLSVSVFWRAIPAGERPDPKTALPAPEELCSVPYDAVLSLVKEKRSVWQWDHLDKEWRRPNTLIPGSVVLLSLAEGGYDADFGWTGKTENVPSQVDTTDQSFPEGDGDDVLVEEPENKTLAEHTDNVMDELERLLNALDPASSFIGDLMKKALRDGARWHDSGKAHAVFRALLGTPDAPSPDEILAKGKKVAAKYERKGFRHELASALAFLQNSKGCASDTVTTSLAAFLIAAHHGKVRLSIRSMPNEEPPTEKNRRFARGVHDGDVLPEASLGGGITMKPTRLDLSPMDFGMGTSGPSWTETMLRLLSHPGIGPFRMAYLEALLRIADWRASKKESERS